MKTKFTEQEWTIIRDALTCYMYKRIELGESMDGVMKLRDICEDVRMKVKNSMEENYEY